MPLAASFRTMNAVSGASEARRAVAGESDALSLDFTDNRFAASGFYGSAYVLDSGTPANYYDSTPDGLLTYTNAHEKFVMGPSGTLRYAPHNLMGYSEAFNNWTKLDATDTVTADVIANPIDGTVNADSFIPSTSIGNKIIRRSWTAIVGKQYYCSIYAKPIGSYTTFMLSNNSPADRVSFTLTGSGSTNIDGGSPTNISITALDDGWYKCSFVTSPTSTAPQLQLGFYSSAFYSGFEGDGTSGGYLWGAQVTTYPCDTQYVSTGTGTTPAYGLPYEWYTSGSQRGLLIEPQATNIFPESRDFTSGTGAWVSFGITSANQNQTDQSGIANSATTLLGNNSASSRHFIYEQLSTTSAQTYTHSIVAKAGTVDYLAVGIRSTAGTTGYAVLFDLSDGSSADTNTIGTPAGTNSGSESLGNGWYRIWTTMTVDTNSTYFEIGLSDSAVPTWTAGMPEYSGAGTETVIINDAQGETGSVPTSLIRTYGLSETRDSDDITMPNADYPTSTTTMSLYAEYVPRLASGGDALSATILSLQSGGTGGRLKLTHAITDGGEVAVQIGNGTVNVNVTGTTNAAADSVNRLAAGCGTITNLFLNGTEEAEYSTFPFSGSYNTDLEIGQSGAGAANMNGHLRRAIILPRRVSDADLDAWTTTGDLP